MPSTARHAARALRNAFLSPGARLFGAAFTRDYLRFAWESARRWGDTGPGTLRLLGCRVEYFHRTDALFLLHEIFANAEYAFRAAGPRPRIVDCGANIGFSVLFFKKTHPGAEILAFEPQPTTFARLRKTVEENGLGGVELRQAAVAGEAGTLMLYGEPGGIEVSTAWGHGEPTEVPAVRLSDHVTGPVDFLKLDVEGAEYGVIDDLVRTGAIRHVREAVIEFHAEAAGPGATARLADTLRAAGFTVTGDPTPARGLLRAKRG
jgi:FkbM family methyltransferase